MGGIVGVLFALGYHPAEIGQGISRLQQSLLFSVKMLSARARQRQVLDNLTEFLGDKTFADLAIPVTLMCVDMRRGCEVQLRAGPLVPALLATSAVPGAFPPVKLEGMEVADGGVIDSLATHVAYEQGADKVIAVDVYPALDKDNPWVDPISGIIGFQLPTNIFRINGNDDDKIPTMAASIWRSVRVMTWYLHEQRLAAHPPDILLRPDVDKYASLDFRDIDTPIQAGVAEAERYVTELRALIGTTEMKLLT
jgi:NTE family protein